jgi:endoglycosylceramidase
VFIETTVVGARVPPGFSTDRNLVFEGHNYGESIGGIPLEVVFDYFAAVAREYGTPLWIGEYGWFSDPPAQVGKLTRYAAKEDQLLTSGDAWWQWRQACGDPHSVGVPGGVPDPVLVHFQRNGCPGDRNLGVVPEWSCTWRPYPRALPGHVTVRVSGCDGGLLVAGTTDRPGRADVWFPGDTRPRVLGAVSGPVERERVPGGWRVGFTVTGDYGVALTP